MLAALGAYMQLKKTKLPILARPFQGQPEINPTTDTQSQGPKENGGLEVQCVIFVLGAYRM